MPDDTNTTEADPKDADTGTDPGGSTGKGKETYSTARISTAPQVDPSTGDDGTDKPTEPKNPQSLGISKEKQ